MNKSLMLLGGGTMEKGGRAKVYIPIKSSGERVHYYPWLIQFLLLPQRIKPAFEISSRSALVFLFGMCHVVVFGLKCRFRMNNG